MLTDFLDTRPIYTVDGGYDDDKRYVAKYRSAVAAYNATLMAMSRKEDVVVFRGNKEVSLDKLACYASEET